MIIYYENKINNFTVTHCTFTKITSHITDLMLLYYNIHFENNCFGIFFMIIYYENKVNNFTVTHCTFTKITSHITDLMLVILQHSF